MHIAFITLGYAPFRTSGFDISGERLVQALLDAGHQVTVIAAGQKVSKETHLHPSLRIHRLPMGGSNWIGYAYRAGNYLRKLEHGLDFEAVHFWDIHFAYAYHSRFVATLHQSFRQRINSWHSKRFRRGYYQLARRLAEEPSLRKASGLLAVSGTTRDEFIHNYGISPEKIGLTRHGIDTSFFYPISKTGTLRAQLGIHDDEPVLMFAGFVTPRKGLEHLARAMPLIHPSPYLVITGRWRENAREQFLSMLGSARNRVIDAGFVPDKQMPAYFSLADVYVSPSTLEGFGLPLAESLACETPVVAADAGSVGEIVGPGGLLVPPGDSNALATAVSDLLSDPPRCHNLGKQGRAYIKRELSLKAMVTATLDAYERFK